MAKTFYFESDALEKAIKKSVEATSRGLLNGLTDVKNDWKAESVDIAPIDSGNLRRQIQAEVFVNGDTTGVEISANAVREGSKRFNYAYYIHEHDAGGRNLLTPGTEKKFLDKPAEDNTEKWTKWIEEEVQSELKKAGW